MVPKEKEQLVPFESLHPRFAWMRDYLESLAPAGKLPSRRQLDPLDLRALLPFIVLVDVHRSGSGSGSEREFRYRLMGSRHVEAIGHNFTGVTVQDASAPAYLERVLSNMNFVVDTAKAFYDRFPMPFRDREFMDSERVYFPLADDGETVDVILVLNGYPNNPDLDRVQLPPPKRRG